ncbi:PEP/pyruvate-binding domain-containing protein [Dehalococcoidia bacterium]|nr:PEP/pyruvate-binding domain-containing protein [Dehalococcoidia bacterium]
MGSERLIFWFEEVGAGHSDVVGRKCANLSVMSQMGMPVPPGFAISIDAYRRFIKETGVAEEIAGYVSSLGELKTLGQLEEVSRVICSLIESKEIPMGQREDICLHYGALCIRAGIPSVPVSVRSSGPMSRPGMFDTYLNVRCKEEVLEKVKRVWSSAFSTRAIAYRISKGIPVDGDMLGVAVQKLVDTRCAGIGFTVDPVTGESSNIIIEANWGLGEGVAGGAATVDRFVIDKETLEIRDRMIGNKTVQIVSKGEGVMREEVPPDMQSIPCIDDQQVKEIAKLAKILEDRLGQPQDLEWCIDSNLPLPESIFLLQTRTAKIAVQKPQTATDHIIDAMVKIIYRP